MWAEEDIFEASDGALDDFFGGSVSISGDYAIVGALGYNSAQWKVYIFHRSGTAWSEEVALVASDGAIGDQFLEDVSISADFAIVGANS